MNTASSSHDFDTIGGRLTSAREAQSLSVSQLARRLGVKSKTMSDWETDRSEPRANRLVMLAGLLGVSPAWILTGRGDGPSSGFSLDDLRLTQAELSQALEAQAQARDRIERAIARLTSLSDQLGELDLDALDS
jgi:transcriptional regulator with XRE-family HTH domain